MTADAITEDPRIPAHRSPAAIIVRKLFGRRVVLVGVMILTVVALSAAFAPWLAPYDPTAFRILDRLQSPRAAHWASMCARCVRELDTARIRARG